jgi:hypothetical protein
VFRRALRCGGRVPPKKSPMCLGKAHPRLSDLVRSEW